MTPPARFSHGIDYSTAPFTLCGLETALKSSLPQTTVFEAIDCPKCLEVRALRSGLLRTPVSVAGKTEEPEPEPENAEEHANAENSKAKKTEQCGAVHPSYSNYICQLPLKHAGFHFYDPLGDPVPGKVEAPESEIDPIQVAKVALGCVELIAPLSDPAANAVLKATRFLLDTRYP